MAKNKKRLYTDYKDIWSAGNASGQTKSMRKLVVKRLKAHGIPYDIDHAGNILAGDFTSPAPCLVAHLDSVHKTAPKNITCNKKGYLRSASGIGGDDKCGIVALLELLPTRPNVNAIFTVDEESGGSGARAVGRKKLESAQYFIEIDRRGASDLIIDICGATASDDFLIAIDPMREKYNFEYEYGMFTDIDIFLDEVYTSAVNLSAGYYEPHTAGEYVKLPELENTVRLAGAILDTVERKRYKIEPRDYRGLYGSYSHFGTCKPASKPTVAPAWENSAEDELEMLQQEAMNLYGAEVVELVTEAFYAGTRAGDMEFITD